MIFPMHFLLLLLLLFLFSLQASEREDFLKKYPGTPYQDVLIDHEMVVGGTDLCSVRYDLIKPILNGLQGPFTVLDMGAAQGYFSFSIAHDYPQSLCVMVDANTAYYGNHGTLLYDLCHLNSRLKNICYLNKKMTCSDLQSLHEGEHFDVVLALLVVHMMGDTTREQLKILEKLLQLGDHVILEVSNNVAPALFVSVDHLCRKRGGTYLGEVTRHRLAFCPYRQAACPCTGELYCFDRKPKQRDITYPLGITKETFLKFNGVFPLSY